MNKRIFITGGCGFIGVNLVKYLLDRDGYDIVVYDNLTTGTRENLDCAVSDSKQNGVVEFVKGDILEREKIEKALKDCNVLVHLAAHTRVLESLEIPVENFEINTIGTFNALDAARKNRVERFIFASSGAVVGETEPPIHEEKTPYPASPYGASKLAGEGYCSAYSRAYGLKTIALRFGNVYGPRSKHKSSVVAKFINQTLNNETCEIYGDGKQTRDFIYIDDLLNAIEATFNVDIGGEVFQIASSRERTVNEVVEILKDNFKKFDVVMKVKHGALHPGEVKRNYSNTEKAWKLLKWKAATRFTDGLYKTIKYFVDK